MPTLLAEVIKYGLIRDAPFFEWLEQNMDKLLQRDPEVGSDLSGAACPPASQQVLEPRRRQCAAGQPGAHLLAMSTGRVEERE